MHSLLAATSGDVTKAGKAIGLASTGQMDKDRAQLVGQVHV